jgi:hypothetical protein
MQKWYPHIIYNNWNAWVIMNGIIKWYMVHSFTKEVVHSQLPQMSL